MIEYRHPYRASTVLSVGSNATRQESIRAAFDQAGSRVRLQFAENYTSARNLLANAGNPTDRADLIVLQVDTAEEDGYELLTGIKADGELRVIPVIVLLSRRGVHEVKDWYDLGASCCILISDDREEQLTVARAIYSFWCRLAVVPRPLALSQST